LNSVTLDEQVINTLFYVTIVIFALFYFCNMDYCLIPCLLEGNCHDWSTSSRDYVVLVKFL